MNTGLSVGPQHQGKIKKNGMYITLGVACGVSEGAQVRTADLTSVLASGEQELNVKPGWGQRVECLMKRAGC